MREMKRVYHRVQDDVLQKLRLSKSEAEGLTMREIHCPYCGFLVDKVFGRFRTQNDLLP